MTITKKYKYIYGRSDENQGSIVEKKVSKVNNKDSLKQLSKLEIMIENLEKRVKALEQESDYPNEKELKNLKVGGTD